MTMSPCSSTCHMTLTSPRYLSGPSQAPRAAGQGCWVAPVAWVCQLWDNNGLGTA